jgi:hypothetical protein
MPTAPRAWLTGTLLASVGIRGVQMTTRSICNSQNRPHRRATDMAAKVEALPSWAKMGACIDPAGGIIKRRPGRHQRPSDPLVPGGIEMQQHPTIGRHSRRRRH